jgi:hypothetical protein
LLKAAKDRLELTTTRSIPDAANYMKVALCSLLILL